MLGQEGELCCGQGDGVHSCTAEVAAPKGYRTHALRLQSNSPLPPLYHQAAQCYAEILEPELAREHEACFTRLVNSRGRLPKTYCDSQVEAIKASLRSRKLFPFDQAKPSPAGSKATGG